VPYELLYRDEASDALDALEADPAMAKVLDAVDDTLDRLEDDPFDRRLGTDIFQTAEGRSVSATPVRFDEWYVFWRRGPRARTVEIVTVARLDV
jgi:hypothetical protein